MAGGVACDAGGVGVLLVGPDTGRGECRLQGGGGGRENASQNHVQSWGQSTY